MADSFVTKTSVAATIQTIVSQQIQEVLNANIVVPGTLTERQAPKGVDTIKLPRIGKFTVATKAASTPVDAQTNAPAADSLLLDQHKVVQFLIEDIAGVQSNIDIMGEYMKQAAVDMAVEMDQYCIDVLEGTSAAAPDHRIAFADTVALLKADVLMARKLLNVQNVPKENRFALISPTHEASLLGIAEFTRVNESGSAAALRNGEFGKLFGFTFLMSTAVEDTKSLFYHQSAAVIGRQIEPKVEYFRDVPNLSDRWSISHLYGAKMLDSGKRAVLIGSAT